MSPSTILGDYSLEDVSFYRKLRVPEQLGLASERGPLVAKAQHIEEHSILFSAIDDDQL